MPGDLTGVDEVQGANKFRSLFFDSIPLNWSYLEPYSTIDIPRHVVAHVDVAIARKGEDVDSLAVCLATHPTRYDELLGSPSKYRLTVVVTAENADPITTALFIDWNGHRHALKVSAGDDSRSG